MVLEYVAAAVIVVALILVVGFNKGRHIDYMTVFRLRGKVVDKDTGAPVAGAEVRFVDRGLDRRRSKDPERFRISAGKSDDRGVIDSTLEYFWGFTYARFSGSPKKDFEIVLARDGYRDATMKFNLAQLKTVEGKVVLDLGTAQLKSTAR